MDKDHFPVEFNNEIDEVKESENEYYTLAVDRLSKLAEGHNDISGGVVNLKQPAQGHQTSYVYERFGNMSRSTSAKKEGKRAKIKTS